MKQSIFHRIAYYYALLFARPYLKGFHSLLFHLALRGLGVLNYQDDLVSGEQYFVRYLLSKFITRNSPIFFDVGANIGTYTATLRRRFPLAKIYSFEPHPATFTILSKELKDESIFCYNKALGSTIGKYSLFDRADSDGSEHATLNNGVIDFLHQQRVVSHPVDVDTLDNFAASQHIEYIDFMKIDTEGSELAILQGATKMISNKKIGLIQFEFNEMNVFSRSFLNDFRHLLVNYKIFRLLPFGILEITNAPVLTEIYGFQNLLAVPAELGISLNNIR